MTKPSPHLLARAALLWRRFRHARDGIAAIEFAMVVPLMLTMWLGSVEVGQAIAANRKIVLVTRTVADLTARGTVITNAELANIFAATNAVLHPFKPGLLSVRITSIKRTGANQYIVAWSEVSPGSKIAKHEKNTAIPLPPGILTANNQTVIMAEAYYDYSPVTSWALKNAFTISEKLYMTPRQVMEITRAS